MRHTFVRAVRRNHLAHALATLVLAHAALAPGATGQEAADPGAADDEPLHIVIVQVDAVALQSPAGQRLQADLVAFQNQVSQEMQARQAAAVEIEQRIAQADSLTADQRRALEREYQDAVTDFQRFQQDKQEEANRMRAEGLAEIQRQIGPVLEALQRENGYDLVLNAQNDLIVLFSDRVDITPLVIERLRAETGAGDP
ncbi:MAG: OmpH family outer membrane protein [Gemmatimonadota bacterium]|nr:OmpH family outer membrane protein [Gemmatimonadota bacterium]